MSTTAFDDQFTTHPDDVDTDKVFEIGQRVMGEYEAISVDQGLTVVGVITKIIGTATYPVVIQSESTGKLHAFKWSEVTAI